MGDTIILKVSGQGPRGKTGSVLFAVFDIDTSTGNLVVTYPDEWYGATFTLQEGCLIVSV